MMTREVKRREREELFDAVRSVIHDWDPYDPIAGGVPDDEFDSEISAVIRQLDRIRSSHDACHVISRVFSSSFEPELFLNSANQSANAYTKFLLSVAS
jgi:hypothetical protein